METENSENEVQNINEANTVDNKVNDIAESSSSSDDECLSDIKRKLILNDVKLRQEIDRSSQYKDISSTDNDDDDRDPDFMIRKEDLQASDSDIDATEMKKKCKKRLTMCQN